MSNSSPSDFSPFSLQSINSIQTRNKKKSSLHVADKEQELLPTVVDFVRFKANNYTGDFGLFKVGGKGDKNAKIYFGYPEEHMMLICGSYGKYTGNNQVLVKSLTFVTNYSVYGPYGSLDGTPLFSPVDVDEIICFHGRAGKYIFSTCMIGVQPTKN